MAKVAMLIDGLRRKPTYEEVIDYIENDPDKIKYPNRAARTLRNTSQFKNNSFLVNSRTLILI
jgi:hypothetical protein